MRAPALVRQGIRARGDRHQATFVFCEMGLTWIGALAAWACGLLQAEPEPLGVALLPAGAALQVLLAALV